MAIFHPKVLTGYRFRNNIRGNKNIHSISGTEQHSEKGNGIEAR
jgi:hypothetical protein